jgi:CHASE3 domain sensor protein
MTNVVFDNILSDLQLRDWIIASQAQLKRAQTALLAELQASNERWKVIQAEHNTAKAVLDQKRLELKQIRAAAFKRLASEIGDQEAPPPYVLEVEQV